MHNKAKLSHNGLTLSQVLFDREGKIKLSTVALHSLSCGTNQIFGSEEGSYKSSLGPLKLSISYKNKIGSQARAKNLKTFNDHSANEKSDHDADVIKELYAQDIFDLGYLLLIAATGGLDLTNQELLDSENYGDS